MNPTANNYPVDLEKLYHYSTPGGFNGILRSKSLWMTSIHYQNDIEEYEYAVKLILQVLEDEYPGLGGNPAYARPDISQLYTFSLTEESDQLSQWRGYSPNGGFSFSFEKNLLDTAITKHGLQLVQCIYEIEEQKEFIRSQIIRIQPQEFKEMKAKSASVSDNINTPKGYRYLTFIRQQRQFGRAYHGTDLARFKHPKFAEEREWRLVKDLNDSKSIVKFREAKDIIIPYTEIPLTVENDELNFASITVGPGPRQLLAERACRLIPCANVKSSDIPLFLIGIGRAQKPQPDRLGLFSYSLPFIESVSEEMHATV